MKYVVILLLALGTYGIASGARAQDKQLVVPLSAEYVSRAMIMAVRGLDHDPALTPVYFADGLKSRLADPHFRFDGFFLTKVVVDTFAVLDSDPDGRKLVAAMEFMDIANRRVLVAFLAKYRLTEKGAEVFDAVTDIISPSQPDIAWYVVPSSKVPADVLDRYPTNIHLLAFVTQNALGAQDAARMNQPDAFTVFAFALDRVQRTDAIEFYAIHKQQGQLSPPQKLTAINYDNWHVGIYRSTFALADIGRTLSLSAQFIDGDKARIRTPIGTWSAFTPSPYAMDK